MTSPNKRRETDLMKLMMNDFKVEMINDSLKEFFVHMNGPADSCYYGGVWKLHVHLPIDYPYSSPSIGFVNKLYHPNVDWESGTICVNVLNQNWSPMFDLVNVFEVFLPQLLMEPNPLDPLNDEAAHLLLSDKPSYEARVKDFCERYAKPIDVAPAESSDEEPSEDEDDDKDSE